MTNEVGRNAPCPCGSGKKYKQCCLRSQQLEAPAPPPVAKHPQPVPELLSGSYNTGSESMNEWHAFWNAFDAASIDDQLAMARECILDEPNFDEEWAFTLFVEYLADRAMETNRHKGWFDLFNLLAERHPDIAATESGPIGSTAVTITLDAPAQSTEHMTTALELLFRAPAENLDYIASVLDHLAYHGLTAPLEYLLEGWTDIVDNPSLVRDTDWMWAEWTATALLARWAEEDIDRVHTHSEFLDTLGFIAEYVSPQIHRHFLTGFFGPAPKSIDASSTDGTRENFQTITLAFLRSLVDDHHWPPHKALFVAPKYIDFLEYLRTVEDPFQDPMRTGEASRSKALREELKHIRRLRESEPFFTPHPDLLTGATEQLITEGFFGRPHLATAFIEAAIHHSPWLHAKGYLKNPETLDLIQRHFKRRLPALNQEIASIGPRDTRLLRNLDDLLS